MIHFHKNELRSSARLRIALALCVLIPTLVSCASSSSTEQAPFSPPVNAESLRLAMATGNPDEPSGSPWECNLSDGMGRFSYQLITDGTGTEVDANNPSNQSNFKWQTTSATEVVTTFNSSNQQLNLTNIQFANRDTVSLTVSPELSLSCTRNSAPPISPPNNPPSNEPNPPVNASQSLNFGGTTYALTTGFEETFRYRPDSGDNHSQAEMSVADDVFLIFIFQPIGLSPGFTTWSPAEETVWLRADLFAPGGNGVVTGTYNYVPDSTDDESASLIGQSFFQDGHVHVDINGDGEIEDDDNEKLEITGGTITIERLGNTTRMTFNVTLENGVPVSGSYEGSFALYENF